MTLAMVLLKSGAMGSIFSCLISIQKASPALTEIGLIRHWFVHMSLAQLLHTTGLGRILG